jgi:hypothetical protein
MVIENHYVSQLPVQSAPQESVPPFWSFTSKPSTP